MPALQNLILDSLWHNDYMDRDFPRSLIYAYENTGPGNILRTLLIMLEQGG
jgi:hypothetical protein